MANSFPDIMTIGETANYLRISLSSLYKLAQDGRIPCQKVGRHWRFRRETIDRWLDAYPRRGVSSDIVSAEKLGE
jgi:excisionase family DNA binding protein